MSEDDGAAFKATKDYLASPVTLVYYRPVKPVQLFTDAACTIGFGFIVKQQQHHGDWRPVMVGSRSLTDAERRDAPIESELITLAWSLRKARKFLSSASVYGFYGP